MVAKILSSPTYCYGISIYRLCPELRELRNYHHEILFTIQFTHSTTSTIRSTNNYRLNAGFDGHSAIRCESLFALLSYPNGSRRRLQCAKIKLMQSRFCYAQVEKPMIQQYPRVNYCQCHEGTAVLLLTSSLHFCIVDCYEYVQVAKLGNEYSRARPVTTCFHGLARSKTAHPG